MKQRFSIGKVVKASLLAAVMTPVASAQSVFEFTFDGAEGQPEFSKVLNVEGIDLTLSVDSPVGYSEFWTFGQDLVIGPNPDAAAISAFSFQFDRDVKVIGYTVGDIYDSYSVDDVPTPQLPGTTFALSGPHGSSVGNLIDTISDQLSAEPYQLEMFPINGSFVLNAGESATFTANFPHLSPPDFYGYIRIHSIVVTAVPEPGTWALMSGGLAALGFIRWRRRRKPA